MKNYIFLFLLSFLFVACQKQQEESQVVDLTTETMTSKTEVLEPESEKPVHPQIKNQALEKVETNQPEVKPSEPKNKQPKASQKVDREINIADEIIGVWEVNNNYYMAVYEIEKYKGNYIGKVHYYNDGTTEYKGKNTKNDYFLEGVTFENNNYKNGKMHMPDGSVYQVDFNLKNKNELQAKMIVQGKPYEEIWKRKTRTK